MALSDGDDDDDINNNSSNDRYNTSRRPVGSAAAAAATSSTRVVGLVDKYGAVEDIGGESVASASITTPQLNNTPYMLHQEIKGLPKSSKTKKPLPMTLDKPLVVDQPRQKQKSSSAAAAAAAADKKKGQDDDDDDASASREDEEDDDDDEDDEEEEYGASGDELDNTPRTNGDSTNNDFDWGSGDDDGDDVDVDGENGFMSIQELLYSSSSYYAIAKPVTITMCLAAFAVVVVNTDATRQAGQEAMSQAYQVWHFDTASKSQALAFSLANAFVMISVIGLMTFVIVFLYKMRFMKCLIGYMILCSATLLGVLGGNLVQTAIHIYSIPVDKPSFVFFMFNFAIVGVLAVFFAQGIPMYVTQGYLVATAVVLAWQLSYFDVWSTWALLFMLALYDLCAVLTPCGPLKALVNAMSEEDAPEMPGLLFEAELPPEAKKPFNGIKSKSSQRNSSSTSSGGAGGGVSATAGGNVVSTNRPSGSGYTAPSSTTEAGPTDPLAPISPDSNRVVVARDEQSGYSGIEDARSSSQGGAGADNNTAAASAATGEEKMGPLIHIPLAIAKVYSLNVVAVPKESKRIFFPKCNKVSVQPLLQADHGALEGANSQVVLPETPTAAQLRAHVSVRLPLHGGRLERVKKGTRRVYLERDKHGNPKRILWVDRSGKVFAEVNDDEDEESGRNSIR
jgi:Presenilin